MSQKFIKSKNNNMRSSEPRKLDICIIIHL